MPNPSKSTSNVYNIDLNVNALLDLIANLATCNQLLSKEVDSINTIVNEINNNWKNDVVANSDISSSLENINNCVKNIDTVIMPVLDKYINAMNILAIAHKTTSSKTVMMEER